jgi:ABC-type uncharacterized transport system auxiliary subunit
MRLGAALVLALLLGGCLPHRPAAPERYFVLDPAPARVRYAGPPVAVAPTGAAGFYGTAQIVYSDSPGTRSRYRYNFWTEPPQATLHDQLAVRLEGSGAEQPRLLLQTEVRELFHDAGRAPGVVRLTVAARLESLPGHAALAQRRFSRAVAAPSFDAAGAAAATRAALAGVLDDIVGWVQTHAGQAAIPPPGPAWDKSRIAAMRPSANNKFFLSFVDREDCHGCRNTAGSRP